MPKGTVALYQKRTEKNRLLTSTLFAQLEHHMDEAARLLRHEHLATDPLLLPTLSAFARLLIPFARARYAVGRDRAIRAEQEAAANAR